MTTYIAYFDRSNVKDLRFSLRFVGITKTVPTGGGKLHFEELSSTVKLFCQNLSLFGDKKHNPSLVSETITEVKELPDDSFIVFTHDGAYLLDPVN